MTNPLLEWRPRRCNRVVVDEVVDTEEGMMAERGIHSRIEEGEEVVEVDTRDGAGMDLNDLPAYPDVEDN